MGTRKLLSCFIFALLFWSCKPEGKYPYAIKDFRKELQPSLTQMVTQGFVWHEDSILKDASDKELEQLGYSENPILRAAAYRVMLNRKSFDHFKIIMNHLDDTAVVTIDAGEWGIWFKTVSDDIINHARWKSMADKNKTIDAVITKHNYLRAAYTILESLAPQEKYYPYIKEMAGRKNALFGSYDYPWTGNVVYAIYGLAKFKKQEDIPFIKDQLMKNSWQMSSLDCKLMREYPDPAYLEVFEKFYRRHFYRSFCKERYPNLSDEFINTLAVYKNSRSAAILDSILNKRDQCNCLIKPGWLQDEVARAVWENPCEAYSKLRKQVAQRIKELDEQGLPVENYSVTDSVNKNEENIRW